MGKILSTMKPCLATYMHFQVPKKEFLMIEKSTITSAKTSK